MHLDYVNDMNTEKISAIALTFNDVLAYNQYRDPKDLEVKRYCEDNSIAYQNAPKSFECDVPLDKCKIVYVVRPVCDSHFFTIDSNGFFTLFNRCFIYMGFDILRYKYNDNITQHTVGEMQLICKMLGLQFPCMI